MFTGLIEEIGRLANIKSVGGGLRLTIFASAVMPDLAAGDSVSVNGICLTVVAFESAAFTVEAVGETVSRTTLTDFKAGEAVNLERALSASSRLGGHFVQGHVDGIGIIAAIEKRDPGLWLRIRLDEELLPCMVEKGSIAVDGVSLTIAELGADAVSIAVIPHTAASTTLADRKVGSRVNIEADILGKYVRRFLQTSKPGEGLSPQKLQDWGY
jgi:riboflavin synthase